MIMKQIAIAFAIVTFLGLFAWALWETAENDAETVARREALPALERAGELSVNNTTIYLWKFEFEGKQCLWVSAPVGRGGRGGLTCWKETE